MVNTTEILGTDGLNASRITINNNFRILGDAINTLSGAIDISGTDITIGGNASLVGIRGQLNVAQGLRVGGELGVDSNLTIAGNTLILGGVTLTSTQLQQLLDLIENNNSVSVEPAVL